MALIYESKRMTLIWPIIWKMQSLLYYCCHKASWQQVSWINKKRIHLPLGESLLSIGNSHICWENTNFLFWNPPPQTKPGHGPVQLHISTEGYGKVWSCYLLWTTSCNNWSYITSCKIFGSFVTVVMCDLILLNARP